MKFIKSNKNLSYIFYWFKFIMVAISFLLLINTVYLSFIVYGLGAESLNNFSETILFILIVLLLVIFLAIYFVITIISTIAEYKLRHNKILTKLEQISNKTFIVMTTVIFIAIFAISISFLFS